jgi:hypothetical protein
MFCEGTQLTANETTQQLFQCCDEELCNNLLRGNPNIVSRPVNELLEAIKKLAVIPVALSVRRSDLLSIRQCDGENARAFFARIKGKAATCAYSIIYPQAACQQPVDFTNMIAKDVLISGLADDEVRREVLGWPALDDSNIEATVSFIEAKEMAREALNRHSTANAISSYHRQKNAGKKDNPERSNCQNCHVAMDKFSWSKRQKKLVEQRFCLSCWRKHNSNRLTVNSKSNITNSDKDTAGAIAIGCIGAIPTKPIVLAHMLFDATHGWKRIESMQHPTLELTVSIDADDYHQVNRQPPCVRPSKVTVVTDTGAQSCLWGMSDFLRCGFSPSHLMPVKHTLYAANKEKIDVSGAILLRLSGKDANQATHSAAAMVYVSPSTQRFYLSRESLIQLGIISTDFPKVGSVAEECAVDGTVAPCGCPIRAPPPPSPENLPFNCTKENIPVMRDWLIQQYTSSTFNQCKHQPLPGMSGPAIALHVDHNAKPYAAHIPASVPLHWQDTVKQQLDDDVALGVLEKVPIGEPSPWCHRMVLARKADGTPRRTVDLSPLNAHCLRETHHIQPPFQQAKAVPPHTWKSVTDAWNGFHSVPLRSEDRQFTTFITPWGRYRYKVAPQGFLASGDGYARRFDEIIADIERKAKCVDDTIMWDAILEEHWWRMINFLELLGKNGVILNVKKFQFCQETVDYAGFRITTSGIKPQEKFIRAIREFPTPSKITDVRSWFGLVNQVGHYNKLCVVMAPFKPLLSPRTQFVWTAELDAAFQRSKQIIIDAIIEGVEIFDPKRRTCLRPDWSKTGIGFFLSQKHCGCSQKLPGCCEDGWKITLAGSRFLKPEESRYAPIEGEALAIAWSLEQTRYFTQGCDNLLIITDHKPLTKLFGDKMLNDITNPRLFRLKQRTLLWRFTIDHMPGKGNHFSDATSRNPVESPDDDNMESDLIEIAAVITENLRAVTWDLVRCESERDPQIQSLITCVTSGIPPTKDEFPPDLQSFWKHRNDLYIIDGILMMNHRIVVPKSLRREVLQSLHAAHQGITAMTERAKIEVYWPGITKEIETTRYGCYDCNRVAPSQARLPPVEPIIPTTPFQAVACDFFQYIGWYYLVAADRLSTWTEIYRIRQGTTEAGSEGLCNTLRKLFSTFGVPEEISSDGGPEFIAKSTDSFFKRWGIHHRRSSAYFPSSNGRAEVAVKAAKRLLMNNISADGSLDNDKMVRALLMLRNTPDPECKLSPAEILFGRRLRDSLPYITKDIPAFQNPNIATRWKDAWDLKERSLKARYVCWGMGDIAGGPVKSWSLSTTGVGLFDTTGLGVGCGWARCG